MKSGRLFEFINRVFQCKTRIQLPKITSEKLILEGYIKEVPHEETWSMGKFTCIFHELTEKGLKFHFEYLNKKEK